MSTFTVAADVTYAGAPTGVDTIQFTNGGVGATATFSNTDFDNVKILDDVEINGSSPAVNRIVVNGGSLDASGWTFNGWAGLDTITINGGAAADTIVGSSEADTINGNDSPDTITGGGGADTLIGGGGNDTFVYNASDEFAAGETIDGGGGTANRLRLDLGGGSIDFSGAGVLANVEKLIFDSAGGAKFASASFGIAAGRIDAVTASAGSDNILIEGADTDLSGVGFNGWAVGSDSINLQGTGGNDTLVGSDQDDTFDSAGGTDHLTGGDGNDVFHVVDVSGYVFDGGAGSGDELAVQSDGVDLSLVSSLTGVERLRFDRAFTGSTLILATGAQVGAGAITTIIGSSFNNFTDAFTVSGAAVDLSDVAFIDWTNGAVSENDTISINGTGGDDQLTGSAKDDTIIGGNGADTLIGGGGDDAFVYNSPSEFAAGETIDGGAGTADTLRLNLNSASSTDFSGAPGLSPAWRSWSSRPEVRGYLRARTSAMLPVASMR